MQHVRWITFSTLAWLALAGCKREETRPAVVHAPPAMSGPTPQDIASEKENLRLKKLQYLPPLGEAVLAPPPTGPAKPAGPGEAAGPASPLPTPTTNTADLWAKYSCGIMTHEERLGQGSQPQFGQTVSIAYEGTFPGTGKVFDSHGKDSPLSFEIGSTSIVKGMSMGVMTMKPGGRRKIFIPYPFAYGDDGNPMNSIPGKQDLIFEVTLLSVTGEAADMSKIPKPPVIGPAGPPAPTEPATSP